MTFLGIWRNSLMINHEAANGDNQSFSNVFKSSHVIYKDNHRNWGVAYLNTQAYKILKDTILFTQVKEFMKETEQSKKNIGTGIYIPTPIITTYVHNIVLENLKVAAALEIHLKARLLKEGYILQLINKGERYNRFKELRKKQETQPISVDEYFDIDDYHFDGNVNRLIGLSENSINFDRILNKVGYRDALKIRDNNILQIIDDYRNLRNQIHLPDIGAEIEYKYNGSDRVKKIIEFVNIEIICCTNDLINNQNLRFRLLEKFSI
jgi:hypothetical protein